ncbi:hypothetical protein [Nocardia sp. alder85J]|uniref:hypothetical protein n=1 Tax=Nocardia sp. alder85J TaxID=2862949 RepID=UPI001CD38621|nr:hypothetical protein [Nocardia sp. alder85J]MCX4092478.1 hypothetical protein [Nocardia sp. alder85J]
MVTQSLEEIRMSSTEQLPTSACAELAAARTVPVYTPTEVWIGTAILLLVLLLVAIRILLADHHDIGTAVRHGVHRVRRGRR